MSKSTIFVAVHGIGDQVRNETVQAVARRVYAHAGKVSALPLGAFSGRKPGEGDPMSHQPLFPGLRTDAFGDVGFAEVYWADVTRQVATAGYTLEESKRWARTLVQRIRKRDERGSASDVDYDLLQQVFNEMIDTLAVSDRLFSLAEKANLGSFDLKRVLDQFLGDVQFFADFETVRWEILAVFSGVMEAVHDQHPESDIVVVAHSEGTVVAFMGLLLAAAAKSAPGEDLDEGPAWLDQVTALMTMGSPIDKHLILWPEIWEGVRRPHNLPQRPIAWWNYYDHGDPIGFKLDTARNWLDIHGYLGQNGLFDFSPPRDVGFTRYPFAGKAHVDYWTDDKVFGHFLDSVAALPDPSPKKPPRTLPVAVFTSYVVPYAAAILLLCVAVYALTKGAVEAGFVRRVEFINIAGYSSLLAGVTIAVRIPRIVRSWWRWLASGMAFGVGAVVYHFTVVRNTLYNFTVVERPELADNVLWDDRMIPVALAVTAIALLAQRWKPDKGMTSLVFVGSLIAVVLVIMSPESGVDRSAELLPTWPVLVGGAFFLYLWWLSALVFDLVFVWHRYIRHGTSHRVMMARWGMREPKPGEAELGG